MVLSLFLAVSTTASAQNATTPSKEEAQKTTYACPMHPKVMGIKEGKCSKCGMALTKNKTPKMEYACPMHPKMMSMKGDNCSKCGMALTKVGDDKKHENHKH